MNSIWIVSQYKEADYGPDYEDVASLWPSKAEADAECARLKELHKDDGVYRPEYEAKEYEIGRNYIE